MRQNGQAAAMAPSGLVGLGNPLFPYIGVLFPHQHYAADLGQHLHGDLARGSSECVSEESFFEPSQHRADIRGSGASFRLTHVVPRVTARQSHSRRTCMDHFEKCIISPPWSILRISHSVVHLVSIVPTPTLACDLAPGLRRSRLSASHPRTRSSALTIPTHRNYRQHASDRCQDSSAI
jgi:hypothetical protein